jgi:ATP-dependent helicase/nuclease subunit B
MAKARFPEQADLFADVAPPVMARGRLFSIAPSAPFLPTLVDAILDGTLLGDWPREGAFWLSDVTIILPTRRARLRLAQEFTVRGYPLLPDIRTFAGEAAEEEPFLPPHDLPDLPVPVSATERRLVLATLIEAWAKTAEGAAVLATPPNAAEIIGLADSLGEVIDDLAIEGVPYTSLKSLPPEDLAANWQKIIAFLDIAFDAWPKVLAAGGKLDAAVLRNQQLRRQAAAAPLIFGDRPVIAAGSTGSIPATADLMNAIAALPLGSLVLPGLDTTLTPERHAALLKEEATPHGHPQYGLAKLLRRLGAGPGEVMELVEDAPRTTIIRRALALADETSRWAEDRVEVGWIVPEAVDGLSIIAARTAGEEARAIALCAREAVGRGETVGLVSPDQNLSRRIAAELKRWDIAVDDPAGTPLFQSPAGRLVRLILALQESRFGPVELIALLRNGATTLGLPRRDITRLTGRIEMCLLRGRRLRPGLAGLREALAANGAEGRRGPTLKPEEREEVALLFDSLEVALAPLILWDNVRSADLAQGVAAAFAAVTTLADDEIAEPVAGASELAAWADDLAIHAGQGPALPQAGRDNVLFALMHGHTVRSLERRRDDIFIWGLLEARLQSQDLMILAGLNEDVWPGVADPGPWLSRGMRIGLGLEPPERRQGQAAHDFEMAVGNGEVVLAYANRLGTSPALPSRLLQRLTSFLGEEITSDLMLRGERWLAGATAIDATSTLTRASRPTPKPAIEDRPRQLSVTEIETLFRSPYDLYAKHTLRLRKLAPLGEAPDARDRGTIVHDIFARFVTDHDVLAADALLTLQDIAKAAFAGLDAIAERRDIWLHRFTVAARQFLDFERARQGRVLRRHAEKDGLWTFPNGFALKGRADRVDYLRDGTAEIIDFKTGGIPTPTEMTDFLAPQLPLEAAMLTAGAIEGLPPARVTALNYIKVGLGPEAFNLVPYRVRDGETVEDAAEEMALRVNRHVGALLLSDRLPLSSRVLPEVNQRFRGDYDHLARVDEWTIDEGDESE